MSTDFKLENLSGLRIAQVIDTLNIGGAERVAVDISNMLVNAGASVELIVIRQTGPLLKQLDNRIQVTLLSFDKKTEIKGWLRLQKALKKHDLIHVHMRHTYGRVKFAMDFGANKVPLIFHDHFGDIEFNSEVPFHLKSIFKPTTYIGVSKQLTEWALNNLQMAPDHVHLLPNTILREPCNEKRKPTVDLIMVGNIRRTKNIEFAIQLANRMNLSLDIVGQVTDARYFQELKSMRQHDKIRFLTNVSDVFPLLDNYRLAVHTAISETGPLVLLEYLKAGLPFLAHETGEVAQRLKSILPEMVVDHFDLKEWEQRLNWLIENPVLTEKLQEIFNEQFGPKKYLHDLKDIYQCALAS